MGIEFEPLSSRWQQNPYPIYRRLQDEAPVHYAHESDSFVVTRYADVERVLRSADDFSSAIAHQRQMPGARLGRLAQLRTAASMLVRLRVTPWTAARGRFLIAESGESHAAMRGIVNRGFTPRRISAWENRARALAAEGVERLRSGQVFDLVHDLAVPLPVTIIAEMLGVESERMHDFKRWSDAFITNGTGSGSQLGGGAMFQAMGELRDYLRPILKARRAAPADDLISTLLHSDGDAQLDDFEIFLFIFLLLLAGNETTTNLLTNSVDALLGHPEELAKVQRDIGLVPSLIEEALRWDSPVQMLQRTTTRAIELHGVRIPKGAQVAAMIGAANRDERQYDDAQRFDVERNPKAHLAFGIGAHFCLGASLARLEAKAALEALIPELGRCVRIGEDREFIDSFVVRGLRHLPLQAA